MTRGRVGAPRRRAPVVRLDADYLASLDGLRALAVALVLLFHLDRLPGGNLGVDAFFVLSGWLITSRLLAEADRSDGARIDLRRFWGARVRRLMPASLAVLVAVAAVWTAAGINVPSLGHDLRWALGWSSNWGTIAGGGDYWARFGEPSPITHFWSLAIEEQFYLVWPLVILVLIRLGAGRRRLLVGAVSAALAVASIAFMVTTFDAAQPTAAYMNTFARAHSLLIGAAAATLTISARRRDRAGRPPTWAVLAAVATVVGIVAASDQRSEWLFAWGFPVFAAATAVIVVAAAAGAGARVLASPPLRWVGDRSYGIYLWHWPVFLLLSPQRAPVDGLALDAVRVTIAIGLAAASYRWLETPIRARRRLTAPWAPAVAAGALVASFALVSVLPANVAKLDTTSTVLLPPVESRAAQAPSPYVPAGTSLSSLPTDISRVITSADVGLLFPQRVLVAGDSTAMQLADALISYSADHGDQVVVGSAAFPGCGLTAAADGRRHELTAADGSVELVDLSGCITQWMSVVARVGSAEQIDVVVVQITSWDIIDIHLPDGRVVSVLDPDGRQLVTDAYQRFVAAIEQAGARVVWVTPPDAQLGWGKSEIPMNDPARWVVMREIVKDLPVTHVDLYSWLAAGNREGPDGRPDGVHMTDDLSMLFAVSSVVPALIAPSR